MIRISRLPANGIVTFKVEGRALGSFGEELRKFVGDTLAKEKQVSLDLEGLLSIDQPTLEFLAEKRSSVLISKAPRYMDRLLGSVPNGRPARLEPQEG
ncbi:MAG TPA: hypothetical protein VMS93_00355 [Candidatus Saccharimonadales bacterium]|nr:hypothetical protein [Candidatus Saccharimonadales bacterium]